jgi:hypothetical protein
LAFLQVSSLGQIENIFSISALTPSAKPFRADFNFCTKEKKEKKKKSKPIKMHEGLPMPISHE